MQELKKLLNDLEIELEEFISSNGKVEELFYKISKKIRELEK